MKRIFQYFFVLSLMAPFTVFANLFVTHNATSTDCTQTNPCLLNEALANTVDDDIIYIAEGNYTINTSPMITLNNNPIQLIGGWDGIDGSAIIVQPKVHVTVIDAQNSYQCIHLEPNSYVNIEGLSIANCHHDDNGSAIYGYGVERLDIKDVNFTNNIATKDGVKIYGGAIYFQGQQLNINNSSFTDNSVLANISVGGALAIYDANVTISHSSFLRNNSWNHAVLFYKGIDKDNSQFIFNNNNLTDNALLNNSSNRIIVVYDANITMKSNIIKNNFHSNARVSGDLIYIQTSYIEFAYNQVLKNDFSSSIIYNRDTSYNIYNNIITQNYTNIEDKSIIYAYDSNGNVIHNTFADNNNSTYSFKQDGPDSYYSSLLENNIFSNHATAIYNLKGTVDAKNNLFDNIPTPYIDDGGTTTLTDNITGSARFINASNLDYHIRKNSDAQNGALSTSITDDIDEDSRPQESSADIGADEYTPGRETFNPSILMYLLN